MKTDKPTTTASAQPEKVRVNESEIETLARWTREAKRTIPAEKPTAESTKPRNYDDAMVEDLAATHARKLTELDFVRRTALQAQNMAKEIADKLDRTQSHAAQLAEALRGVIWKCDAHGSWKPTQAEREAMHKALAAYEDSK